MNSLFVSLGTSPAIVPEAFFFPNGNFQAVHVLTTEKPDVKLIQDFFRIHAPDVELTIARVDGFQDFTSEEDHFHFEEVLYRWILHWRVPVEHRFVCLTGGFKTMSAAMQKAAAVLGAREVFHVLADPCCARNGRAGPPETIEEILQAHTQGHLRFIRLGPESGWPQLAQMDPDRYPLVETRKEGKIVWVQALTHEFRTHLREIVERSHRIAGAWDEISDLPFPILATWSRQQLDWLNQPLNPDRDRRWVAKLPKIELHCHLGGFATHGELLEQVRMAAQEPSRLPRIEAPTFPPDWPLPAQPIALTEYQKLGDANGTTLLKDPGCLRKQCELLYQHFLDQNIVYAEVRCSPANYADPKRKRSPWDVLCDIRNHFQQLMDAEKSAGRTGCHVNLILIGTRKERGDYRASIARHLSLAVVASEHWTEEGSCRVVGVDLAGYEDPSTRPHYFRDEFTAVLRCGLAITVHAGENDDAEAIWRAVFDLNARRIGHALSLAQSDELIRSVADRGIAVEMCPYANYQLKGFALDSADSTSRSPYPLLDYLEKGVRVTVNTDNIGISAATLTDNLLFTARLCPRIRRLDLLHLQRHALDAAFCPPSVRRDLYRRHFNQIPSP